MVIQMPAQEPKQVPPSTKILELLDNSNGALLILGEPGSGKTTVLLELASQGIDRAQNDATQPIPVIFNLSSWTEKQSFDEWLVNELQQKYYVPKKVGEFWIENGDLMLLLDGLDESKSGYRESCVQSINSFLANHSMPVVICSRWQEYEMLATHLRLQKAVFLKPLSEKQIEQSLAKFDTQIINEYVALLENVNKQTAGDLDILHTPLFLSIMILTFQNSSTVDQLPINADEDRQKAIFDRYIDQMLRRRGINHIYTPRKMINWLSWLAKRMIENEQTVFLIDLMQPNLLLNQIKYYYILVGIFLGLILSVPFLVYILPIRPPLIGVVGILLLSSFTGAIWGVGSMWLGSSDKERSQANLKLIIPIYSARASLRSIIFWALIFIVSLIIVFFVIPSSDLVGSFLLAFLPIFVVASSTLIIFKISELTEGQIQNAGHAIRTSANLAIFTFLGQGLVISLLAYAIYGYFMGVNTIRFGVFLGLLLGIMLGLENGGFVVIKHLALRLILICLKKTPRNFQLFLEHATNQIFLYRVGSGYIFIHRMLMEHFAAMVANKTGDDVTDNAPAMVYNRLV